MCEVSYETIKYVSKEGGNNASCARLSAKWKYNPILFLQDRQQEHTIDYLKLNSKRRRLHKAKVNISQPLRSRILALFRFCWKEISVRCCRQ